MHPDLPKLLDVQMKDRRRSITVIELRLAFENIHGDRVALWKLEARHIAIL